METQYGIKGASRLFHITKGTVAKIAQDKERKTIFDISEANAIRIVAEQTTIPVPRVRRIMRGEDNYNYIIMDYIPGRQLCDIWPDTPDDKKAWVFATLKDYVTQLRGIRHYRSKVPGPVAQEHAARIYFSPLFGNMYETRGPFPTYQDLTDFMDSRNIIWSKSKLLKVPHSIIPFNVSWPLVLSHQDISPGNIILGNDGKLWLIDWAWAGFYPIWFEGLAMKIQALNEERVMKREDSLWASMIPTICGEYPEEEAWFSAMSNSFYYM